MRTYLGNRKAVGGAAALLVVCAAIGIVVLSGTPPAATAAPIASPTPESSPTAPEATPRQAPPAADPTPSPAAGRDAICPLSGLPTTAEALERTALAVQIENHPAARPASNLSRADLVIEAPVEGDTTRFTAIYLCQPTDGLIGPVRSARYYNIDLWQDLGVLTVGYGASPGGLERFARAAMPYLNGITGEWPYFERISARSAPHNLYADIEALRADLERGGRPAALAMRAGALRPPFSFGVDAALPSGRAVSNLTISTNSYWHFGWTWRADTLGWERHDAGVPIVDAISGEPLSATSVVVQVVTQETVHGDDDSTGSPRRLQHLVGSGTGTAYVGGRALEVAWSRPSVEEGTSWTLAESGEALVLPPGVVWWEIVPTTVRLAES